MPTIHNPETRGFASDNYSGIHPEVLTAIGEANGGHQPAYGADEYTARLQTVITEHFGENASVWPVFNGTGANVLGMLAMLPRWGAVICADTAHIHADEGGAPEKSAGIKLLPVATPDGKLTPELIAQEAWGWGDEHRAQPLVIYITQSTELGTVYTPDEVRAITEYAHERGMHVFMDGARLANAAAALDLPLRAFTTDAGVDALALGGTKNGAMGAEAVVVLNEAAASGLVYLRKHQMQLASKMRFVSAQLLALLDGDLFMRNARHANAMAQRLRSGIDRDIASDALTGVAFTQQTQANAIFATLPAGVADRLREKFRFYDWDAARGEVRWVCSFDTAEADVDAFLAALREELAPTSVQ